MACSSIVPWAAAGATHLQLAEDGGRIGCDEQLVQVVDDLRSPPHGPGPAAAPAAQVEVQHGSTPWDACTHALYMFVQRFRVRAAKPPGSARMNSAGSLRTILFKPAP